MKGPVYRTAKRVRTCAEKGSFLSPQEESQDDGKSGHDDGLRVAMALAGRRFRQDDNHYYSGPLSPPQAERFVLALSILSSC
jgi:hypothetical protein